VTIPRSWSGHDGGGRVGRHDGGGHVGTAGSYGAFDDTADRPDVPVVGVRGSRWFEPQPGVPLPVRPRPLVGLPAAQILAYYRAKGDMGRTQPYVARDAARKPSKFNTPTLRRFRLFSLSTGRCGLSNTARAEYWESVVAAEVPAVAGTGKLGPMQSAFDTAAKFVSSLKH